MRHRLASPNLRRFAPLLAFAMALSPLAAQAVETVTFTLAEGSEDGLKSKLRNASLIRQTQADADPTAQDYFAAALADYQRLTEVLYANGYYSGVLSIKLDGREAAKVPATAPPTAINKISVTIDPRAPFRFGKADISPLPAGALLPDGFATGRRAKADLLIDASQAAQTAWRDAGHAKVRVAAQDLVADHAAKRLDASVTLSPGPVVQFGDLTLETGSAVRENRIRAIAGMPSGHQFSPADVDKIATRLRRSGAFRSVSIVEADHLGPDNTLDLGLSVVDAAPRRYGAGIELSNQEGLTLSGFWMHRNLFGGAEKFRIEGEVSDIAATASGVDYSLGMRLDRPASFGPDTDGFLYLDLASEQEPLYALDEVELGFGASRIFSPQLSGSLGLSFRKAQTTDGFGTRDFALAQLPLELEWDKRDEVLNTRSGHYVKAQLTPYLGIEGAENGAQLRADARLFRPVAGDRVVAAGRLQFGSVLGSSIEGTAPDFLLHSGGGGTVRGQPYQSLGVDTAGVTSGGRSFLGLSGEVRGQVSSSLSLVGFVDAGYIGAESLYDGSGDWHAGAGLGLRYDTPVGPIRLDVAAPISGPDGVDARNVQIYIGIGQAF